MKRKSTVGAKRDGGEGLKRDVPYERSSLVLGFALGRILAEYGKAYIDNPRRAFLSLGDYLWRLMLAWGNTAGTEERMKIATGLRFKLVDLRGAKASLDLIAMQCEEAALREKLRPLFLRDRSPGERRFGLADLFPKHNHSTIQEYEDLTPPEIALREVARRHGYQPSTLRRRLSQTKRLNDLELRRRNWLQQFNISKPPSPIRLDNFPQYFLNEVLPAFPTLESQQAILSVPISSLLQS
jgi:hypothetical protein